MIPALLVVGALVVAGCAPDVRDDEELRSFINRSELNQREFTYQVSAPDKAFTVEGAIEDDFRYRMTLLFGSTPVVEQIISDDARAIRLPNPDVFADVESLGHPEVDAALREARWVVDPSAAPPLIRTETGAAEGTVNPFTEALTVLGFVRASMTDAAGVREFNFEAIDYKPSQDPWVYPRESLGQSRYDTIRPPLPKTEDNLGGDQRQISASEFRKLSAFVQDDRIYQVCSLIDIDGHEDFIELEEAGPGRGNPYHRKLLEQIEKGDTQTRIVPEEIFAEIEYEDVSITLPDDAHIGRLDQFELFENEELGAKLVPPGDGPELRKCDRPEDVTEPEP